jgi:hypothetical protein
MKFPLGPYKGRHPQDCPRDYLFWLLRQDWLVPEFRERVETILVPDNAACLGPRWWHIRRAQEKRF